MGVILLVASIGGRDLVRCGFIFGSFALSFF